ncbi:MAG: exosome complex protein Rrp42 [Candidatus Thorarchaeota archaeon]|nr:exosome complex protein Rrp42 [Candidatus Thorarchaeota archaeon]
MNKVGDFSSETISRIDREFIADLLNKGNRIDGRAFDEYRPIEIEANVVPAKAEGSALVRLGDTSVVAGVKVLVGEPYPDSPDEGVTMVAAEMSPIASPLFELGPPKEDAIELARIVDRGVRESETIDNKQLCIVEGKKVYMVFADVYPLEYDGNLIDASSIAVNVALMTTKYPEMVVEEKELVPSGKVLNLPIKNIAVEHTISKIGEHLIVDPILKEEFVQDCRLTMAVDQNNNFTALQKGGAAGPMSVDLIDQAMGLALDKSKEIRDIINEAVKAVQ